MMFRAFRLIVGLVMLAGAAWLVADGGLEISNKLSAGAATSTLVGPVLKIVAGLLVAGIYYWAVWSESRIHEVLENVFSIPELVQKLLFTLGLLVIYRIGFHVPLPGMDQYEMQAMMGGAAEGGFGQAMAYFGMFTGGSLSKSTLFGLGIMPYISASIIFQLLATVLPSLERLRKEGPAGQKKIQEYTRYATV